MQTKQDILDHYRKLPRREKESIGTALVKVNLGVALPEDQKRVAVFLKGSPYISKQNGLHELIDFMQSMDEDPATVSARTKPGASAEDSQSAYNFYEADEVTTAKQSKHPTKKRP